MAYNFNPTARSDQLGVCPRLEGHRDQGAQRRLEVRRRARCKDPLDERLRRAEGSGSGLKQRVAYRRGSAPGLTER
eukprot:2538851-Prymnesium_polylepis.1